jgi:RNA polymerase sigma-70 factor, ECF subfamily
MTEIDEQSMILQAKRDPQVFANLYDRYVDRIYTYALRQTSDQVAAQDITSATFEKALRYIRRYRWQGQSFCAWLYRIARNESIAMYRKQRFLSPLLSRQTSPVLVEQVVEANQQYGQVRSALASLSASDREILTLRYYENLSNPEISEVLGCSVENVSMRIYRALKRLQKQMQKAAKEPGEVFQGE